MSSGRLSLCFGIHNHQPIGNFEHVLAEATEHAYRPFLERVRDRSELKLTMHCTGSLLEWLRDHAPATFDLLGTVVARGQVELLTGGFYEPILAILPDHDQLGQIERLTEFLKGHFGVRPRGMWLAERVWEPHLPRVLRDAGVEYVLVDDSHFALAGFDPEALAGYYLTEEQGAVLGVFPISQRLRYLIPFAAVDESLAYLDARRRTTEHADGPVITVVDDGEKFGAWPGTYRHVYEEGWLDRFSTACSRRRGCRSARSPRCSIDSRPPVARTCRRPRTVRWGNGRFRSRPRGPSPRPSAGSGRSPNGERVAGWLRAGFWRTFLTKYAEVGDTYWKMLRLSNALRSELVRRPDDRRLEAARLALWRGQANDAYWHGVFGGCYLPHLRRAVKQSLLEGERLMAESAGGPSVVWTRGDLNGDGAEEIIVRTERLTVTINPERGGTITELGWLPCGLDLADVFTRRPELYHDQIRNAGGAGSPAISACGGPTPHKHAGLDAELHYDEIRRASLIDGLFDAEATLDPVAPWSAARCVLGRQPFAARIDEIGDGVGVTMTTEALGLAVDKRVTVGADSVTARYHLRAVDGRALAGRWAVQWNLTLTAGDAPGRYLTLPGRPSLGSRGRAHVERGVTLVDEWIGVEAVLAWEPGAELAWGPVETISVSEGGFERIYQGSALLLSWPLHDADTDVSVTLTVRSR